MTMVACIVEVGVYVLFCNGVWVCAVVYIVFFFLSPGVGLCIVSL